MCVILICPEGVRPDRPTLEACHEANPHGAGVAWRQDGGVRWLKGLDVEQLASLVPRLPGEIVVHFRWASVGEAVPALCHPFPVTRAATTRLSGRARAVLFHNGTWSGWGRTLRLMPGPRLAGPMSDTRVAASLVDLCGTEALDRLPGRWVFFERGFTLAIGGWRRWGGMTASNLGFVRAAPPPAPTEDADAEDWWPQPLLPLSDPCGHPDTPDDRTWPHNANHEPMTMATGCHPNP